MPATDFLKSMRGKGYGSKPEGMDKTPSNETPRVIKLSEDEQKYFEGSKPGEDLTCEVHGSLTGDGGFRVMSLTPSTPQDQTEDEQGMAKQVAQRVMPMSEISPS